MVTVVSRGAPAACTFVDCTLNGENSVDLFLVTESELVKTDSCMDSAMTEIERPKMIVCFEKEDHDLVKDICVDNGVQSFDKVSLLKDKVNDLKFDATYHEGRWTDPNDVIPVFDNINAFLSNKQSISDAHSRANKQKLDKSENHKETEIVSEPAFLPDGIADDLFRDGVCFSTLDSAIDGLPRFYDAKNPTLQCSDDVNHQDSSKQDSFKANTQESSAYFGDELGTSDNSGDIDRSSDVLFSDMDKGNTKLFINKAQDTENETEGTSDPPLHGHCRDVNRETSNALTAEARSSLVHYGFADASLFGPHSMPNSISFIGPTAYKGSTSLRSDSSTTSTSSFAFPVLQSEWNSSPVKMAKADRKYHRRQRWRNGFLCCSF